MESLSPNSSSSGNFYGELIFDKLGNQTRRELASWTLSERILTIICGRSDDNIELFKNNFLIGITINGETQMYNPLNFKHINIFFSAGNNTIIIGEDISVNYIDGGAGKNTLINHGTITWKLSNCTISENTGKIRFNEYIKLDISKVFIRKKFYYDDILIEADSDTGEHIITVNSQSKTRIPDSYRLYISDEGGILSIKVDDSVQNYEFLKEAEAVSSDMSLGSVFNYDQIQMHALKLDGKTERSDLPNSPYMPEKSPEKDSKE